MDIAPEAGKPEALRLLDVAAEAGRAGRHEIAETAFLAALAVDPGLAEARLGLGLTYMALRQFDLAARSLEVAVASPEAQPSWRACLGQALLMTGAFRASAAAFASAHDEEPLEKNARTAWLQARCLADLADGEADKALSSHAADAGLDPPALLAFAEEASTILAGFGYTEEAAAVERWRQARSPPDPVLAYRLAVLEKRTLDRAPPDYVQAHFDAFAERFDHQLVTMLGYRAPEQLTRIVASGARRFDHVLDLGCGTGLAMAHLRPMATVLSGVDLSAGMLARASARGGYDALVQAEALTHLEGLPNAFDLIFAADLLIYFGRLDRLFAAAARALRPRGLFGFSIETTEAENWTTLSSGRFAHGPAYVEGLATDVGLRLEVRQQTVLRHEGGTPVRGALYRLAKRRS